MGWAGGAEPIMVLDQISLLTAIGFSSAALTVMLLASWFSARRDIYLLSWAAGMALVVPGVVLFSLNDTPYDAGIQLLSLSVLLAGFAGIYLGAWQFHRGSSNWHLVATITCVLIAITGLSYALGLSGVGTAAANIGIAILMALSGYEYWAARKEAPIPLVANSTLYLATSISFALCGLVLMVDGDFVLTARPANWAEDLNAVVIIAALTGIGALSVTLNQLRAARHHRREAMTDPLTGMLNRRALFDAMSGKRVEPGVAVIMFDLDHFKSINDRLGHAVGDLVLQRFAEIVHDNIRSADISARLGGEEFCIVLGQLSSRSAATVAERIRAAFEANAGPVMATASAGLAFGAIEGEAFENLLGRADNALYQAKSAGRNRVHAAGLRLVA